MTRETTTAHPAFAEAMKLADAELDEEMRGWDLARMLDELRAASRLMKSGHNIRAFAPKHLGMPGKGYKKVIAWLADPTLMRAEDISHLVRSLKKFRDAHGDEILANELAIQETDARKVAMLIESSRERASNRKRAPTSPPKRPPKQPLKELNQKLVGHTVTLLNSLNILMSEAGVTPTDAYDSERMHVRDAMQKLCTHLGIKATFADRTKVREEPLTYGDFAEIGVSSLKGGKK